MGPGATLARAFYHDRVQPLLAEWFPGLRHLAGRLGSGSDVLGFDDERSIDHDFGCRLTLLVDDGPGAAERVAAIDQALQRHLPPTFEGWPVRFAVTWDDRRWHRVDVHTVPAFARSRLGLDADRPLEAVEWLALTGQSVLELTGGPIFHDSTRSYAGLAERLRWYPDDVWRYLLASSWFRVSQELPFVGRCGHRGDDLGSRLIAARLARDLTHLALLLERTWPPYPKWVGRALAIVPSGPTLGAALGDALAATTWPAREQGLVEAATVLGHRQAERGLPVTEPIAVPFFDRPFRITHPDLPTLLAESITDPWLRLLPVGIGSVEQWCDNVTVLATPQRRADTARRFYEALTPTTPPSR